MLPPSASSIRVRAVRRAGSFVPPDCVQSVPRHSKAALVQLTGLSLSCYSWFAPVKNAAEGAQKGYPSAARLRVVPFHARERRLPLPVVVTGMGLNGAQIMALVGCPKRPNDCVNVSCGDAVHGRSPIGTQGSTVSRTSICSSVRPDMLSCFHPSLR